MNISRSSLDWSLIQAFLAVAETGSLSGAARMLGSSQPTVGRQIKTLEQSLVADLFTRKARGLELTETGTAMLPSAQAMREAMSHINLTAAGQSARLEGTVRITASVATSLHHLPAIIARIREAEPDIAIELVPNDATKNLLYREADIAVRMYRPTQLDLVARHIGDLQIGVFAARSFLARHAPPKTPADFAQYDFVGFDQQTDILEGFKAFGLPVSRDFFKTRCDDHATYLELIRAGCGIGFAQRVIGLADPALEEIALPLELPVLPIWLTAHEAMRQTPRIRRVWDMLAEGLTEVLAQQDSFSPSAS